MDDKTILQKAIEKAEKGGFDMLASIPCLIFFRNDYMMTHNKGWVHECLEGRNTFAFRTACGNYDKEVSINELIFNHDFAKAFWHYEFWQYYLQQMVLEKEPLKYLEIFLDDKEQDK